MKRKLSFILALCLIMSMSVLAIGCNKEPEHNHSTQTAWQTDATHHWHACDGEECEEQLNKTEHVFGTELRRNDTHHYLMCECGEKSDEEAHVYDHVLDTFCNVCGPTRAMPTIYELQYIEGSAYPIYASEYLEGIEGGQYVFKMPAERESGSWEVHIDSTDGDYGGDDYIDTDSIIVRVFDEDFNEINVEWDGIDICVAGTGGSVYIFNLYSGEDVYIMVTLNETTGLLLWLQ